LMIVDLIRNDLNLVCDPLTVEVPSLMKVESYETVHQLVTEVSGRIRNWDSVEFKSDPFLVLQSNFPPGSMTGSPKIRSCELLSDIEAKLNGSKFHKRGPYSGILGWVGLNRASEFAVIIRSAIVTTQHGKTSVKVGAGGAITYLSDDLEEFREMELKANAIIPSILKCLNAKTSK
jgi:para-aminobenzoate synthetase